MLCFVFHAGSCTGDDSEHTSCTNGDWSTWSEWTICTGSRERSRTCDNPPPTANGMSCSGDVSESESCTAASWGTWGDWTLCSDVGSRSRERTCISDTGDECLGTTSEDQVSKCFVCHHECIVFFSSLYISMEWDCKSFKLVKCKDDKSTFELLRMW